VFAGGKESTVTLDTSPSLLIPYYDADTKVLVLAGRGESNLQFYEYQEQDNTLLFLTKQTLQLYTNSFSVLPKRYCNVENIEIMIGYRYYCLTRLLQQSVERFTVTVPRLKKEFFQDDIFQPTFDVEKPLLSADQWISGKDCEPIWLDLNTSNRPLCISI
jgi:coronin-7